MSVLPSMTYMSLACSNTARFVGRERTDSIAVTSSDSRPSSVISVRSTAVRPDRDTGGRRRFSEDSLLLPGMVPLLRPVGATRQCPGAHARELGARVTVRPRRLAPEKPCESPNPTANVLCAQGLRSQRPWVIRSQCAAPSSMRSTPPTIRIRPRLMTHVSGSLKKMRLRIAVRATPAAAQIP